MKNTHAADMKIPNTHKNLESNSYVQAWDIPYQK
jgi:hypothetical protein